jgi:putative transposase
VRRSWIDAQNPHLSIARQCELAGVSRSGWYYEPVVILSEDELNITRQIDEIFTECPMYGSPRITEELKRRGVVVNHKRVERLMRSMGIEALYPKPKTSIGNMQDKRFPYLLKGILVLRPNQVWGTDFTFIRIGGRWHYLIAFLDWFSRYVVAWDLCEAATAEAAGMTLTKALTLAKPEIHNSDQGCQFTADTYTRILTEHEIRISMDGRGRCFDNIFTERLWRTVKYEEVFVKDYVDLVHARSSLTDYFHFYDNVRLHSSLNYKTPAEIYFGG